MNKITIEILTEGFAVTDELDSNIIKIRQYIHNKLGVNIRNITVTPSQDINIVENKFPEDVERIKRVMNANISDDLADKIWKTVSEYFCANWLILPENDEDLYQMIKDFYLDKR